MKKLTRWMLALALCLALVVCGALAAETPAITVQLDGQPLAFTDAVPQVKDQRTFLPFRAVFEAMGAEVSNEGNVITAVRGGKTLTMTVGSAEATVVENGVTTPITMDVAPYVDASTWRTYVPVRFAAQAFDCAVGWDGAANTAVIVDTEKLVQEATAGKTYTYLEKFANLGEKYNQGIWNMDAAFDMDMTMMTTPMMSMDGAIKGVMEDSAKMDMTMNMKMDMSGLMDMAGAMGGEPVSDLDKAVQQAMLDSLKTKGVDLTIRGDINTGKLYMNMDMGALVTGLDPDTWYELDMAALMAQAGMNWSDLMTMSENANTLDALASALATNQPNDAANGYAGLKQSFEELFTAFADQSFVKDGNDYVLEYTLSEDDTSMNFALILTMDGDTLTGYTMGMVLVGSAGESGAMRMEVGVAMTADGKMDADLSMDMGGAIGLEMTMEGAYTPGTTAPVVTPPAGAKIVSFTDLMGQSGDLGVIGGQDGPTAIFVGGAV